MARRTPTFVLVHGTESTSTVWAPLARELGLLGHRVVAVDLAALDGATLDDRVDHVVDVVLQVRRHGPVILVGHSQGGLTLSRVSVIVPELIDHIAYVDAYCCGDCAETWGRIPRTYVRFSADRQIPLELQDRMIAEADQLTPLNRFAVHTLDAPHGALDRPELVPLLAGLAS